MLWMSESTGPGRGAGPGPGAGPSPRVLVVDDEPFVVKIAQRVLERDGLEVLSASTGEEALTVLTANPSISLILLDSNLPDMNAQGFLELMRDRGFSTKVLLSSGLGEDSMPAAADFPNVSGFLSKPYPVSQLSMKVRELLAAG
jgi:CheY-like chemotaxis protein